MALYDKHSYYIQYIGFFSDCFFYILKYKPGHWETKWSPARPHGYKTTLLLHYGISEFALVSLYIIKIITPYIWKCDSLYVK